MANSIDFGSARARQIKKALGDETRGLDLRVTAVIRRASTEATPASSADEFQVGDKLIGTYVATDRHFLRARLHLQRKSAPIPPRSSTPLLGVGEDDGRELDPRGDAGGTWELDTTHMQPSDYVLTLEVVDRTLLDSGSVTRWSGSVAIDFRLSPAREQPASALSATTSRRGFSHVRRM